MPRWLVRLLDAVLGPPAPRPVPVATPAPVVLPMPRPGVSVPPAGEASLAVAINRRRIENNLSTLVVEPRLTAAARWIAADNARRQMWPKPTHAGSDGSDVGVRVARQPGPDGKGYAYAWVAECGDILLPGMGSDQAADAWMKSDAHRVLMLASQPTEMGVGIATSPEGLAYAFLVVARPLQESRP